MDRDTWPAAATSTGTRVCKNHGSCMVTRVQELLLGTAELPGGPGHTRVQELPRVISPCPAGAGTGGCCCPGNGGGSRHCRYRYRWVLSRYRRGAASTAGAGTGAVPARLGFSREPDWARAAGARGGADGCQGCRCQGCCCRDAEPPSPGSVGPGAGRYSRYRLGVGLRELPGSCQGYRCRWVLAVPGVPDWGVAAAAGPGAAGCRRYRPLGSYRVRYRSLWPCRCRWVPVPPAKG